MTTRIAGSVVAVGALCFAASAATAQVRPTPPQRSARAVQRHQKAEDARARFNDLLAQAATRGVAPARVSPAPATLGDEAEPNDTTTSANLVSLGDTIAGVIDPAGDFDYFAIDVSAGTVLEVDVDAQILGSALDPVIGLFDTNGECCLAVNDDWDGLDSRIVYAFPAEGRYFVAIVDYSLGGGADYDYRIAFTEAALDEVEPNDTPGTATLVALGDTVVAALAPATEVDYFAVDVPDRTLVSLALMPYDWFAGIMTLYGTDGTSILAADTLYGWPYGLEHFLEQGGRYYVSVRNAEPQGAAGLLYALLVDSIALGPGDPVTLFASAEGYPMRMAAGGSGELYVADAYNDRMLRVSPEGAVTLMEGVTGVTSIVVDGYGDVLAAGYDYQTGRGLVWRITPSGAQSVFIDDSSGPWLVTIAPDGDVWTVGCTRVCPSLRRYDPTGRLEETIAISNWPEHLAFAPNGQLHFSTWGGVYRLAGTTEEVVIPSDYLVNSLAFDRDGRLYLVSENLGTVQRYSAAYERLEDSFARVGQAMLPSLAFGRDAVGAMEARLFVAAAEWQNDRTMLRIYEVNPDGLEAPGFRIGVDLLRMAAITADTAEMGAAYTQTLTVADPPGAVSWSVEYGALPPGLSLDASSGTIAGTPTQAGQYQCTIRATSGEAFGVVLVDLVIVEPGVVTEDAVNTILGIAGTLTPELEMYLDLQGNNNGRYDIGDLRAYLRAKGAISAPPAVAKEPERSGGR